MNAVRVDTWLCEPGPDLTGYYLTGDTRKIFVSKTVDESHSARVLIGCKPISYYRGGGEAGGWVLITVDNGEGGEGDKIVKILIT